MANTMYAALFDNDESSPVIPVIPTSTLNESWRSKSTKQKNTNSGDWRSGVPKQEDGWEKVESKKPTKVTREKTLRGAHEGKGEKEFSEKNMKSHVDKLSIQIQAKNLVHRIFVESALQPELIATRIESEVKKRGMKDQFVSIMLQAFCGYTMHEALTPAILGFLHEMHDIKYPALHYVAWLSTHKRPFESPLKEQFIRTPRDFAIMTEKLFTIDYTPLQRNEFEENALSSLAEARRQGVIGEDCAEEIYHVFTHPPPNVVRLCSASINNLLSPSNVAVMRNKVLWLFVTDHKLLVSDAIGLSLKTYGGSKKSGFFKVVRDQIDRLRSILSNGPDMKDVEFGNFFAKNKWNSVAALNTFHEDILERALEIHYSPLDLYKEEFHCLEVLGALVGESKNPIQQQKFMIECLNNPTEKSVSRFVPCFTHSLLVTPEILQKLSRSLQFLQSSAKFSVIDVLENHYRCHKCTSCVNTKKFNECKVCTSAKKCKSCSINKPDKCSVNIIDLSKITDLINMKETLASVAPEIINDEEIPETWDDDIAEDDVLPFDHSLVDQLGCVTEIKTVDETDKLSVGKNGKTFEPEGLDAFASHLSLLIDDDLIENAALYQSLMIKAAETFTKPHHVYAFNFVIETFARAGKIDKRQYKKMLEATSECASDISDFLDVPNAGKIISLLSKISI